MTAHNHTLESANMLASNFEHDHSPGQHSDKLMHLSIRLVRTNLATYIFSRRDDPKSRGSSLPADDSDCQPMVEANYFRWGQYWIDRKRIACISKLGRDRSWTFDSSMVQFRIYIISHVHRVRLLGSLQGSPVTNGLITGGISGNLNKGLDTKYS